MSFLNKLFKKKQKPEEKVSDNNIDQKLQNNQNDNNIVINMKDSKESDNEIESFIVYVNHYKDLIKYGSYNEDENKIIERELSCFKILIRTTLTLNFLNSLDFFSKINHQKKSTFEILEDYLDWTYIIDPDMTNDIKICIMVSGSIQDYIDFIDNYQQFYANENNSVVGVILREMKKFPIAYEQFDWLIETYNLDLKHNFDVQGYTPKRDSELEKKLSLIKNEPDKYDFMIIEPTTFDNGYDDSYVPESFDDIIKLLWKKELDNKKFNCIVYTDSNNNRVQRNIPYFIKSFSKLYYFPSKFEDSLNQSVIQLQEEHARILNEFTYRYHINNLDSDSESNDNDMVHRSMLDMVDEII